MQLSYDKKHVFIFIEFNKVIGALNGADKLK